MRLVTLIAIAALTAVAPAQAAPAKILVYTGDSALISGFTKLAAASGRSLDERTALPGDLSPFPCVVLPSNDATFTGVTLSRLVAYVKGGGHLLALGDGSIFRGPNANMNAVAQAAGSTMTLEPADIDIGFHTTTNIDPGILTGGVTSIVYAFTSRIHPGEGASLFRTAAPDSTDVIAAVEPIGTGLLVLSGDSNVWSDSSAGGYTSAGNGIVARNLCGLRTALVAEPAVADLDAPAVTLTFRARLTESESAEALPGRTVTFSSAGAEVCSAVTDAEGVATCGAPPDAVGTATTGGYDASFAGAGPYTPSAAHGAVARALGTEV